MITSPGLKNRRTGTTAATALAATALVLLPTWSGQAADILKADNTDPLSLTSSWVPSVVPGVDDVAVWNNTVTGANATTLDLDLSWRGIRIANPGGAVSIANSETILSLGSDGIDLSAATQNLTIGTSLVATADQTWSLASGRTLNLWTVNTNRGLSGEGDVTLQGPATGSGAIVMLPGSTGSVGFDDGSSNSTFMGDWIIGPDVTVQVIRNGRSAWGNGVIRLNGGRIGQIQGQWTWTNEIALGTGTTSTIANFSTGANRFLKLQGTISGAGNLILDDTTGAMGNNALGFIVTGTNTMSGTVTIPVSRLVRLGGVPGDSVSTAAGIGGTFGTAGVVNNGTLTLSHSDAWTFGNNVSGSGTLVIGNSAITGTATQVATVSGANTYTGITTVNNGRLNLTGSLTSTVVLQQGGSISGAGTTTGSMNFFGGTQILLAGGETTTGLSSSGASFFAPTKASFLTAPAAATIYDILTYGPGNVTEPGNLSVNAHGTLTNTGTKFTFLAAGSQSRTWKGVTDTWQEGLNTPWVEGDQLFYNGDNVIFGEPTGANTVTLLGPLAPASVAINNTAETYTFTGAGAITGTTGLTKTGAGALTISSNTHSFTGDVNISAGTVDTGTAQGNGTTGFLGAATGDRTITVQNAGTTLTLRANNQFGGAGKTAAGIPTVVVDGATLDSTRFNILGNVTLSNGATLTQSSTDSGAYEGYEFIGGTITAAGTGSSTISSGNGKANHLAGGQTTTFNVANTTGDSATDLLVSAGLRDGSGDYGGSGALTKTGSGTLELAGENSYTGETIVEEGTLVITGSILGSAMTVNSGGILSGLGFVNDVLVNQGGVFAPGNGVGAITAGLATFNGGTFALELTSTGSDQLIVTGGVNLMTDSPLAITLSFAPAANTAFTIINNDGFAPINTASGLFSLASNPLSEGERFMINTQEFAITYAGGDGNDVVLTAVPEPSTALSLLGGLGILLGYRRGRRRRA